ncbi:hypothetical protein KSP40_PGU013408 [Platanthera guangdongensis]|uniref:C2H2-type domain-containing protein n=1 Tax=Platanthera guangdongensis TaxID=2320717 RepID=A0ABR2MLL9_9ASPA
MLKQHCKTVNYPIETVLSGYYGKHKQIFFSHHLPSHLFLPATSANANPPLDPARSILPSPICTANNPTPSKHSFNQVRPPYCRHLSSLGRCQISIATRMCEERVQKIQSVKMLEGIFICAAPHCLKSFLKKAEFESHVHESHADLLLQPNADKEGGGETSNFNTPRPSSADLQKQLSSLPESSTARAPLRSGFSPSSNSQPQDRDDRPHRPPSRDQPYQRPPPQLRPPHFISSQPHPPGDGQTESNMHRAYDRPFSWFSNQQDTDRAPSESMFPNFPAQSNYQMPPNPNQPLFMQQFNYPAFQADGSQPFFGAPPYDMPPRPESTPPEGASEQGSVLGLPPAPAGFRENYPRPWGMDLMSFANPADSQGGMAFFHGEFVQGFMLNPLPGRESDLQGGSRNHHSDGKGLAPSMPGKMALPPPPPLPPPLSHQINRGRFPGSGEAQGMVSWQSDKGRFGNWTE